jgi:hypothetical protein
LYFGLLRHRPISEQAGASPFLLFHTPIGPIQYQLAAAGGLAAVTEPPDGPTLSADSPIRVIEAAPGSPQGAWPVIARIPSPDGGTQVAVGIAEDGAFRPIDADQTMKEGLTMHGNTLAYAAFVPLAGTRTFGPLAALAPLSTTTGSWEIRTVDLGDASDTPASLGQGSDPRFLPNGDILAYADEGVVRIDPKDGTRTVVVPRRSSFVVGLYAASPDLSRIAVSDALNSIEIYALSSDGTASSTGSIADALAPISFFGDNKLAAISEASSTLELWDVSSVPSPDRSIPLPAAASTSTP